MRPKNVVGIVVVTAGMSIAVYRLLLTDEARRNLREMGMSLAHGCHALLNMFDEMVGEGTDLDQLEANRAQIQESWRRLGY